MQKYKILVVDDESDNLALLYRTLRNDYEVKKTLSPLEALEMLQKEPFQIIISDHKMPFMDGVEFLKRSQEFLPEAIRILVTAYSDAKILIDAINYAKIYRYVKKPYQPAELLQIVQAASEYYQLKEDNEVLISDLKNLFEGTIKSITEALDAKDSYTLGKSRRVTFYSMKIAQEMKFSKTEIGRIELAGLLHDIGMIGIREDILTKVDPLTPDEFEEIKNHVNYSIKILEDIKQLDSVIQIIKAHHERYDGSGYPLGLKGDEIPKSAQIIAVADAYESLLSDRSYRPKLQPNDALEMIRKNKGAQFAPDVVDIFERIFPIVTVQLAEYERSLQEEANREDLKA